jgi:hypothetical protein
MEIIVVPLIVSTIAEIFVSKMNAIEMIGME